MNGCLLCNLFLTVNGILNPHVLKKSRKTAYFIITVTSMQYTPSDLILDFIVIWIYQSQEIKESF
ncbi:twin-arginine translocase subunit TatC [Metabacillus dongyingensis]|uniref:twin-arginine translocase subunit TatC n=1 Tax=Metabacillus dongyingensis TaxID=2874282 RepID=UPI003B8C0083